MVTALMVYMYDTFYFSYFLTLNFPWETLTIQGHSPDGQLRGSQ